MRCLHLQPMASDSRTAIQATVVLERSLLGNVITLSWHRIGLGRASRLPIMEVKSLFQHIYEQPWVTEKPTQTVARRLPQ